LAGSGGIRTRRASREDLDVICRLWRHLMDYHESFDPRFELDREAEAEFKQYVLDILDNYLHAVFVATRDEKVLGYTIVAEMENPAVFRLKRYGFVCEICVDPQTQGAGVGQALYERAVRWFKRRNLSVVQLNVAPGNEAGRKFYERLGFKPFLNILWLDLEAPGKRD